MSSSTSQDGSFFVNKSALDHDEEEDRPRSTELKKQPLKELPLLKRVPSTSVGSTPMESGPNSLRGDLLPPLFPPRHRQESCSNDEDEQTTALWYHYNINQCIFTPCIFHPWFTLPLHVHNPINIFMQYQWQNHIIKITFIARKEYNYYSGRMSTTQ